MGELEFERLAASNRFSAERNYAEKALTQGEQHFRTLCDAVSAVFGMSDAHGNCVYLNRRWIEFTGRTLNRALGAGWLDSAHPERARGEPKRRSTAFTARKEYNAKFRVRRADGEYRRLIDSGVRRYTLEGRFTGYVGSCIDVTDRKKIEQVFHEQKYFLEKAQDLAHVGSWVYHTADAGPIGCSREVYRIFGIRANNCDGNLDCFLARAHPEDKQSVERAYKAAIVDNPPTATITASRVPMDR